MKSKLPHKKKNAMLRNQMKAQSAAPSVETASPLQPLSRKEKRMAKQLSKYRSYLAYGRKNDISYQGPLTASSLNALGWFMMVLSTLALVLSQNMDLGILSNQYSGLATFLQFLGSLSVTFFMTARVGQFFHRDENYLHTIILYAVIALGIALGCTFFYYHYMGSIATALFNWDLETFSRSVDPFINLYLGKRTNFNLFVDLLIIALLQFFALYSNPKWSKKQSQLFHSLIILPILYFLAAYLLKYLDAAGFVRIPFLLFLYLPSGSPLTFVAFLMVIAAQLRLKKHYLQAGGSEARYEEYTETRHYSWVMAKKIAMRFFIIGVLDVVLFAALIVVNLATKFDPETMADDFTEVSAEAIQGDELTLTAEEDTELSLTPEEEADLSEFFELLENGELDASTLEELGLDDLSLDDLMLLYSLISDGSLDADGLVDYVDGLSKEEQAIQDTQHVLLRMGAGDLTGYLFFAPFMLLFSLNKKEKKSQLQFLIPVLAIASMFLIFGEGILAIILHVISM